ncbi:helix-turn-helix domain-containing protein [Acidocella aminolytica]|uniref:HTH cro/C1-type domain-containing protein n=3 Tax=Acidocella TaxID=50709 RepID=A0A0D6PJS4_9PROT|nr:transcriptional regulator [Acidocella aminolytica]GAN81453.1 hypothetical protein Aam_096_012 [Acidocella aminolytica 101 = DSM 11237]GBQ41828.1 hypothetical protein AA11237_2796 [Acidocella aminolytica 101 = DSM 11237]
MITSGQIRAARGYLGITAEELANLAGVSRMTIVKAESMGPTETPPLNVSNLKAIEAALKNAGINFGLAGEVGFKPQQPF